MRTLEFVKTVFEVNVCFVVEIKNEGCPTGAEFGNFLDE